MSATLAMRGEYNYGLVGLSVLIAVLASYAALELAGRVTAARGRMRWVWIGGGALAMGTGIWSMHYIGMLAFTLPVTIRYHLPTVLLSLVAAVLASAVALIVVSRPTMGLAQACAASLLMGGGIAGMHLSAWPPCESRRHAIALADWCRYRWCSRWSYPWRLCC